MEPEVYQNRPQDTEILVKLVDENEIEPWKQLMLPANLGGKYVCPNCGKDVPFEDIEPLVSTPKFPKKEIIAMNVCHVFCTHCYRELHTEFVTYGAPFESLNDLYERIGDEE